MKDRILLSFTLLFMLVLTSCAQQTPSTQFIPSPSPSITPTEILLENDTSIELVEKFGAGWASQDPDLLLPLYSKDVEALDAGSFGITYHYSTVAFALSLLEKGEFYFDMTSYFVTNDGRYAALIGNWFELHNGEYTFVPALSLLGIDDGQVVWEYDYYAGENNENYPIQEIPLTASEVRISEEKIAQIEDILSNWVLANNEQDLESIATFYADDSSSVAMCIPEWIVQTKNQMSNNLGEQFADETLSMTLGDTFVSANGQYAAVQGVLEIVDVKPQPFVMLIEIEDGKIIKQNIYLNHKLYCEKFK